jgi:hypothetical protein
VLNCSLLSAISKPSTAWAQISATIFGDARVIPDARPRVSGRINWRWDHTDSAVGLSSDTGRLDLRCIADCLHGRAYRRQSASAAIVDTQRLSTASKMVWLGVVAESLRELGRKNGDPITQSLLFRLERASNPNEAKNAADAFRWWVEENHLMEIPEHCG